MRRVVTMLQMMQKKVQEEGAVEKKLYDKFMCYCKTTIAQLEKSIDDAKNKIPQLESSIKETQAEKAQLEDDVKQAKKDRADAQKAESMSNIAAMKKAIAALEKGMAGDFLQTAAAGTIRQLVMNPSSASPTAMCLRTFCR